MNLRGSIVWKLSALFVGCMVAVTMLHGLTIRRMIEQRRQEEWTQALLLDLEMSAYDLQDAGPADGSTPEQELERVALRRSHSPLYLLDLRGRLVARAGRIAPDELPELPGDLAGRVPTRGVLREELGEDFHLAARRVRVRGADRVLVAVSPVPRRGRGRYGWPGRDGSGRPERGPPPWSDILLQRSMIAFIGALLCGILGVRLITARLATLEEGVRRLSAGDLSVRLDPGPRDEFGRLIGGFNTMAESLQKALDEVATQDRTRRELVADVSHELRTPLTGMLCHLELMQEHADQLPEGDRERLRVAVESGKALASRIQDLLTLAREDVEALPLTMEPVNVQRLLQRVVDRVRPKLGEAAIDVVTQFLPDIVEVQGDPGRLEQVFGNLVDNAMGAMFEGGTLTLRVATPSPDEVVVEVEDTGSGIESGELPTLFARYQRGAASRAGGTGLGLAIVKRLVERHGGRCEVLSRVDEGTTFRVVLPVQSAP